MQAINREKFFDSYRDSFGPLNQSQVDGLESILDAMEADKHMTDLRHCAYALATVKRECGDEWKPVKEYSRGKGRDYGKVDPKTGKVYYGRGYVQLTWKGNYAAMGKVYNIDLVNNPDLALDPEIAYKIMSYGMRHGTFTGVGLSRYIHGEICDYINARRVINGTDVAEMIAGYAEKIEAALRAGVDSDAG
jgi:putative chitinase